MKGDTMGTLDGKTALVTGGGRGIGRGIVLELAKEGSDVVIADIDLENAHKTATETRTLGRKVTVIEMDVAQETSVVAGISTAIAEHGRIDILVNNAGVVGNHVGGEVDLRDWDMCYEVNLKGIWIVSRAVLSHFKENGGGKIVNIASIAGRHGSAGHAHYSASKAGAISVTQSLAKELGKFNINVNAVCPGLLWTDIWRQLEGMFSGDDSAEVVNRRKVFEQILNNNCPLGREQTPEDVGMAVAFLASERARNITGQALNVDGGISMN
jgi:meso-butanediol dehydrogenase / (S,S)-butanediol dehydrogenase / diacetyl reductase